VANENRKNLLELLKDLAVYITEIITFINTVVNFIKVLRGDMRLVTMVALVLSMVFGLLACLYVRFRRRETGEILGYIDNKPRKVTVPYYPEWARSLALVGLVVIPLLAASGVGYYFYQQARPPHKIIILIANFDGPEPEKYRVTETVLARLRAALERYRDLQVEALGRAITEQEGKEAARAEGEKRKAAIVIWGWYGVTKEVVPISVTFELLRPPKYMPELGPEAKGMVRTMAVAELESFTLQTRLSEEMTYLSLFTVGMARYAREDWDGAIACFSDALSQTAEPMRALDQSIIYFYRGNAYTSKGDYDRAVADYNQAIDRAHELKLDFVEAYVNRGVAYANAYAKKAIMTVPFLTLTKPLGSSLTWPRPTTTAGTPMPPKAIMTEPFLTMTKPLGSSLTMPRPTTTAGLLTTTKVIMTEPLLTITKPFGSSLTMPRPTTTAGLLTTTKVIMTEPLLTITKPFGSSLTMPGLTTTVGSSTPKKAIMTRLLPTITRPSASSLTWLRPTTAVGWHINSKGRKRRQLPISGNSWS